MLKLIAGCTGIIVALLATAVLAGGPQQIAECRAANKKAHAEVELLFQQARTSAMIIQSERNAFTAAEYKHRDHGRALMSERLTLPLCQQLKREISQDRANVQRMAPLRR